MATVLGLYAYWGGSNKVSDKLAIDKINQTLATLSTQANLDPDSVMLAFSQLEKELAYSAPAQAKLGGLYSELGMFDNAIASFEQALDLNPQDSDYLEQWIYSHSLRQGGKLPKAVREEAESLVAKDPQKYNIINLLAIDDYFHENYLKAITQWQHLLVADTELKPEQMIRIQSAIKTAEEKLDKNIEKSSAGIAFKVNVKLKEASNSQIGPDDTVFLFVRHKMGSKMPLAVLKKRADELPFTVCLDDKHMMVPGSKFIPGTEVEVVAKISKSGDPLQKDGDIVSKSATLTVQEGESVVEFVL